MNFIILLILLAVEAYSSPIDLKLNKDNVGDTQFNVILPSNETIQISLSVRLMKHLTSPESFPDVSNLTGTTSRTTVTNNYYSDRADSIPQYVSVEEAVEAFRQELIEKEKNIGGIIFSDQVFYRHFKLEFDVGEQITIRCSYNSDYNEKKLKIGCVEYKEISTERILASGEIEHLKIPDTSYRSDYVLLDLRKVKQTYNMDIS